MWRDDAYFLDIVLAARKIQSFTSGHGWEAFESDEFHRLILLVTRSESGKPLTPTLSRRERQKSLTSAFSGAGGEATERRPLLRRGLRG
jgi:hypothetical protein